MLEIATLSDVPSLIVKAGLSLTVALPVSIAFYRVFLHPLSCVPGPRLATVSNAWHAYHARNGRMLELGRRLHREYGRAVRVGPDEVWFDSVEAFKAIYGEAHSLLIERFWPGL
jgi:hypothetical protein